MNLSEIRKSIEEKLALAGFDQPSLEAKWLIEGALSKTLILHPDYVPTAAEKKKVEVWLKRRLQGEPLSRIKGMREFWSLPFYINGHTLDPRPETELIVEGVLKSVSKDFSGTILDLGTGSGCILIALLHELKNAKGIGIDQNPDAIEVARTNATLNQVEERATFTLGNWGENLEGSFDIIVSNPPYIPLTDKAELEKGVRDFDPPEALFAGVDGLDCYRILAPEIKRLLTRKGLCFLEIGQGQAQDVQKIMGGSGLKTISILKDLAGIERVICLVNDMSGEAFKL